MATVKFKAHKHHKKADGTINVKLVVYHKASRVYPDTDHYVTEKQLNKKYEFKDPDLIAQLTAYFSKSGSSPLLVVMLESTLIFF